jgi:hypothetical protein
VAAPWDEFDEQIALADPKEAVAQVRERIVELNSTMISSLKGFVDWEKANRSDPDVINAALRVLEELESRIEVLMWIPHE